MTRHSLITTLFLIFSCIAAITAQTKLTATIIDAENKQPLVGATVLLLPEKTGTTTNTDGTFSLSSSAQTEKISISYMGYESAVVALDDVSKFPDRIALQRARTTLDEVVVSSYGRRGQLAGKSSNLTLIPTAQINASNPLSSEEMLRQVPGVNIIGDMGLSNRPNISIRGAWGRRSQKVLLLEDGSPFAPAPYLAPGAYYNPLVDRLVGIEVYKGADLLRYGPNNMYGAVNLITALPPQQPTLRLKLVGGQRDYRTALVSYGGTYDKLGFLVEGVYKHFDGFVANSSVDVLNINAKLFAQLSDKQSFYFKISGQYEDNLASLSSQTPFTFEADPTQNPLDADQFTMRRYGMDIIHRWLPSDRLSFTTKIYASDFERDWWRQITTKVRASEVRTYVGESIYQDRYRYLEGRNFGPEDYVIVGRVRNGRESTSDSRWIYTVAGLKESMQYDWKAFGRPQQLEASINLHRETYKDVSLVADSSRWARFGRTTSDLQYRLWSANGYLRNEFNLGKWSFIPILRLEYVDMYRQNLLAQASNPDLMGTAENRDINSYTQFLPGLTTNYRLNNSSFYGSIYRGMIAPSTLFGFLAEQDGIVTNPTASLPINILPELAWNREIGWRGEWFDDKLSGQIVYFNNRSQNLYLAGRNEVFEQLGSVRVQGLELASSWTLVSHPKHLLSFSATVNLQQSQVLSGRLADSDLFSQVIHSSATQAEYLEKVNNNRAAFDVFVRQENGQEVLFSEEQLSSEVFSSITKSVLRFGEQGLPDAQAPYTPSYASTLRFDYSWRRKVSLNCSFHAVGKQFTEFHNFVAESADGAIGQLPAYKTLDINLSYDFKMGKKHPTSFFLNGKNITNDIYKASRLNRATSGVFGGGFRQLTAGINLNFS